LQTILYSRVSTRDQTLEHQITQAESAGFTVDEVIADHGVSGVQQRLQDRPEGRRLFDKLRAGDVLVLRWLDRLGRNYEDVTDAVRHFIRAFLAATAQAQAEASKVAQKAGIELAKKQGDRFRGRKPSYDRKTFEVALHLLNLGNGPSAVSKETGLSRQTLIRIRDNPEAAFAAIQRWGL